MAPKKKQFLEKEKKLTIIRRAEEIGYRPAAKEFGVSECNIRRWVKNKGTIMSMAKKRKSLTSCPPKWPELEKELLQWVKTQRENGLPVSTVLLRLKGKEIAETSNIPDFTGGTGWCSRFMKRHKLSMRMKTTVGQKLPDDWQTKVDIFQKYVFGVVEKKNVPQSLLFNMDEVPLSFDTPPNRTIDEKGVKSVFVKSTGHEKSNFTVVLACAADGTKLKPMVIFKRKTIPKENFPEGVVIKANPKGWMNEDVMLEWLDEVFPHKTEKCERLLVLDSMRAHICDSVKAACKADNINLAVIPGGLTKKVQPLDLSVNRVFKCGVRRQWEQWMGSGLHLYTKLGHMKRAQCSEVARWINNAWKAVKPSTITKAFKAAGIVDKDSLTQPSTSSSNLDDLSSSSESENEDTDVTLDQIMLSLFHSDTEDSDIDSEQQIINEMFNSESDESEFEGFSESSI